MGIGFGTGFGDVLFGKRNDIVRRKLESLGVILLTVGVIAFPIGFLATIGVLLPEDAAVCRTGVVSLLFGEKSSSICRFADMKGSYLSENPLELHAIEINNPLTLDNNGQLPVADKRRCHGIG